MNMDNRMKRRKVHPLHHEGEESLAYYECMGQELEMAVSVFFTVYLNIIRFMYITCSYLIIPSTHAGKKRKFKDKSFSFLPCCR
jgi:hypothetical protein